MFKVVIGVILAAVLVVFVLDQNREADLQAQRNIDQRQLLAELEGLNKAPVSKLVDEWRQSDPNPSDARLTELRVLAERIKSNPDAAEKYTAAAKQKKMEDLPFSSPLGTPKAKPGING